MSVEAMERMSMNDIGIDEEGFPTIEDWEPSPLIDELLGSCTAIDEEAAELLGVPVGASVAQVRKAYRKLVLIHHPDKGGDPQHFNALTEAYNNLV